MNSPSKSSEEKLPSAQPSAVPAEQELSETELDVIAGGKTDKLDGNFSPGGHSSTHDVGGPFRGKGGDRIL